MTYGSVDMMMIWLDATTGDILFAIHMGGTIHDYGAGLAVRNGKALMVGTSSSPIITTTNTLDVLIVEIDKSGANQCELF